VPQRYLKCFRPLFRGSASAGGWGESGPAGAAVDTSSWLYRTPGNRSPSLPSPLRHAAGGSFSADGRGVGAELANLLAEHGQEKRPRGSRANNLNCRGGGSANGKPGSHAVAAVNPLDESHYERLLKKRLVKRDARGLGVIICGHWNVPDPTESADAWQAARRSGCARTRTGLARWPALVLRNRRQLYFVTAGCPGLSTDRKYADCRRAVADC